MKGCAMEVTEGNFLGRLKINLNKNKEMKERARASNLLQTQLPQRTCKMTHNTFTQMQGDPQYLKGREGGRGERVKA